MILWVYPESPGPLIHFNPKGWGVHLWATRLTQLYFRLMPRSRTGRRVKALIGRGLKPRTWNYVAASYNHRTGLATLWCNGYPIVQRNVGRFPSGLATNYPIMIGRKPRSRHVFRGRIACLQVFNVALTRPQIIALQKKCFRPSKCYQQLRDLVHFIELFQLLFLQVYFIILLMYL